MPSSRAGGDVVISFRLGVWQRASPLLVGFLGATVIVNVALAVQGEAVTPAELTQWVSWALFAVAVATLLQRRYGVVLTADALVLVGDRRRLIPWAQIERVEVRRSFGVRQVAVRTGDGRRTVLRAPVSLGDPGFEEEVRVLVEWWAVGRSASAE